MGYGATPRYALQSVAALGDRLEGVKALAAQVLFAPSHFDEKEARRNTVGLKYFILSQAHRHSPLFLYSEYSFSVILMGISLLASAKSMNS